MSVNSKAYALSSSLFLLWVTLSLIISGIHGTERAELFVESGNDANIDCSLTLEEISTYLRVVWKWKPWNETTWMPLPRRNVNISNYIFDEENETKNEILISTVTLLEVSVWQSGMYACLFEGTDYTLDETKLLVGYPPEVPISMHCETNGMVTTMVCYWNPGKETYLPTTYQLHLFVEVGFRNESQTLPASRTHASVDVSKSYTFVHYMTVEATNDLQSVKSDTWSLTPSYRVKPDPPREVVIDENAALPGDTACSVIVAWQPPQVNAMLKLVYIVRYRRTNWDDEWVQSRAETISCLLPNLASFTSYDIQVAARPSPSSFLHAGFPSEWTAVKSYRTQLLAPTERFLFKSIIATKAPADLDSGWKVEADWFVYGGSYQPGFYYDLSYAISNVNESEKLLQNNYTFYTAGVGRLNISGSYCNAIGCSPYSKEFVDLDKALSSVNDVDLILEEDNAIVTWKFSRRTESYLPCIAQLCSTYRVPATSSSKTKSSKFFAVTKHNEYLCKEVEVSCHDQRVVISSVNSACQQYQAIVYRVYRTGIHQILTPSLPSEKQTIDLPMTAIGRFEARDSSDWKGYRITTNWDWNEALCNNMNKNLVLSVLYTPISGSECLNETTCRKNNPFYEVITNCSKSLTRYDITSDLYGGTTYELGLGSCCNTMTDSPALCFSVFSTTDTATTAAGVPGLPHHLQWKESNPLKAYWSPPEHKNGPLDGYLVQYGKLTNVSQFETVAYENIFTHNTETELPLKCKSMDDNTVYRLRVSAYNIISGHKVFGPFITEETHLCRYINPDSIVSDYIDDVAIIAGVCSCLFFILVVLGLSYWQRKRLKSTVRKHIWPSIPTPNILIQFSHDVDKDGKSYKNVYDDEKTFSNTAYCDNNKEDNDDLSCREVPDDIRDCNCHSSSNNNKHFITKKDRKKEILCEEKKSEIDETDKACKNQERFIVNLPMFKAKLLASRDDVQLPCCGQSSFLTENDKSFVMFDSCQTTATWRTMLYPSSSKATSSSKSLQKSNSFSGSSGNSFNGVIYMKDYHGNDDADVTKARSNSIKYTTVSPSSTDEKVYSYCDVDGSSSSSQQNGSCQSKSPTKTFPLKDKNTPEKFSFRLCRGESWYDGFSTYSMTSTAEENLSDGSAETSRTESGSPLPYITIPTANKTAHIMGVTTDEINDDYCGEGFLKQHPDPSTGPDSPESLQHFYPVPITESPQWEHANRSFSDDSNPSWTPSGLTEMPLLECYSPPPVTNSRHSYITMNEVLHKSKGQHPVDNYSENTDTFTNLPLKNSLKFDFNLGDPPLLSSSSGAASYVFQTSLDENESSSLDEDLSAVETDPVVEMTSYISTAQANLIGKR